MKHALCDAVAILSLMGTGLSATAQPTAPPDEPGLRPEGPTYFPAPQATKPIPLPGGDMETEERPPGFIWGRCNGPATFGVNSCIQNSGPIPGH
jgi:hypothetical protein